MTVVSAASGQEPGEPPLDELGPDQPAAEAAPSETEAAGAAEDAPAPAEGDQSAAASDDSTPAEAGAEQGPLATVVVTARKREEDVQDIPDSVTVFSKESVRRADIEDVSAVVARTPSLNQWHNANGIQSVLLIRGFGTITRGEPSVAVFVDNVYQAGSSQAFAQLFDVERVEVLKGPQTTLYGKSSTAGAIAITTRKPTGKPEGYLVLTAAGDDLYRATGAASGPLVGDTLLGRIAFDFKDFGGFFEYTDGSAADEDSLAGLRASLVAYLGADVEVIPVLTFRRQDARAAYNRKVANDADYSGAPLAQDRPGSVDVDNWIASLTVNWDVTPEIRVTALTGSNHVFEELGTDLDFSAAPPDAMNPLANLNAVQTARRADVSQELRVGSSDDDAPLRWLVGGYAFYLEEDLKTDVIVNVPGVSVPTRSATVTRAQTYSVFGQANWRVLDTPLELGLGLRYDYDKRTQTDTRIGTSPELDEQYDSLSTTASASWFLVEDGAGACVDAMLYAKWSLGEKAGGFNQGDLPPFGQERVQAFELGFKTSWFERALTLNGAAFLTYLEDFQVARFDNASALIFTDNDGRSRIAGVELELRYVLDGLELGAALSYLEPVYTHYHADDLGPNLMPGAFSFDGETLPLAHRFELKLQAAYRHELGEDLALFGLIEGLIYGPRHWDRFNIHKQDPYAVVNLRLGVELGVFKLELFATNLLDEEYFTGFVPNFVYTLAGASHLGVNSPPRQVGLRLSAKF